MFNRYWALYWLLLISIVFLSLLLVLGTLFSKKLFFAKGNGWIKFCLYLLFMISAISFLVVTFIPYCKDYKYASNGYYIEAEGIVTEFTKIERHSDGDGKVHYYKPKFYFPVQDQYVVLHLKDVTLGETYLVRYLPNTKISEVVKKTS